MPDIPFDQQSSPTRLVGGGSSNEENTANVSTLKELSSSDILNNAGSDTVLTIGTLAVELKTGASTKVNRKSLMFMPLDTGFSFGFSPLTQNVPVFKNQVVILAVGEDTKVYAINKNPSKQMVVVEL